MVHNFPAREANVVRVAFAISIAALASMVASGKTQALPIAPLPAEVMTEAANTIPVYYYCGRYIHTDGDTATSGTGIIDMAAGTITETSEARSH